MSVWCIQHSVVIRLKHFTRLHVILVVVCADIAIRRCYDAIIALCLFSFLIYTHTCSNLGFMGLIKCTCEYNSCHTLFSRSRQQMRSTSECNCIVWCDVYVAHLFFRSSLAVQIVVLLLILFQFQFQTLNSLHLILAQWSKIAFYICQFLLDNWHKAPIRISISCKLQNRNWKWKRCKCMCVLVWSAMYQRSMEMFLFHFTDTFCGRMRRIALQDFHDSMIWSVRPLNKTHMHGRSFYLYASTIRDNHDRALAVNSIVRND